jgi:hypothetical protein
MRRLCDETGSIPHSGNTAGNRPMLWTLAQCRPAGFLNFSETPIARCRADLRQHEAIKLGSQGVAAIDRFCRPRMIGRAVRLQRQSGGTVIGPQSTANLF